MSCYIALRLRKLPVIHWFVQDNPNIEPLQQILVKTQHGCEVAKVLKMETKTPSSWQQEEEPFIKEFLRPLNEHDKNKLNEIAEKEKDAFKKTKIEIQRHKLNMKLLKAEYLFDYGRVIFYFKSENKVDFRELLKSLAALFKTRIELRQIGVRDEAKLLGGIGCCGKEVCCAQFMTSFVPVSTKMAKEQNLSLNPAKLSGICGRLLCCLSHEYEYYASFKGKYPKIGSEVVIGEETARVMDINYITQKMSLGFKDRRKITFELSLVKGRRDKATGRNLWWIQRPDEEEPDLSILLENLNPPGSGKKRRRNKNIDDKTDNNENNTSNNADEIEKKEAKEQNNNNNSDNENKVMKPNINQNEISSFSDELTENNDT